MVSETKTNSTYTQRVLRVLALQLYLLLSDFLRLNYTLLRKHAQHAKQECLIDQDH